MSPRIAVVYYSATGNVYAIADALAKGAAGEGAEVRLRRVAETAPDRVVDRDPEWRAHLDATADVPDGPPEEVLAAATHQGARLARITAALTPVRAS
jgi:NAD(P)H dehydrogenase (quinone)